MHRIPALTIVALLIGVWHASTVARADPNHQDPDQLLEIHSEAISGANYLAAAGHYTACRKTLKRVVDLQKKNRLAGAKPKDFLTLYGSSSYLRELAKTLEASGEPAGVDLGRRQSEIVVPYYSLFELYKGLEPGRRYAQKVRNALPKSIKSRDKELEQIRPLAAAKDWKQAHARLTRMQYETFADVAFLAPEEIAKFYEPISELRSTVDPQFEQQTKTEAFQALGKARDALLPNYRELATQLSDATKTIGAAGKYSFGGQSLNGPQTVAHFRVQWADAQLRVLRARTMEWARITIAADEGLGDFAAINQSYRQFAQSMPAALAKLISSDAAQVKPADARQRYVEYLQALAPLKLELRNEGVLAPIGKALDELAGREAKLVREIADYRLATDELLRWKRRAAARAASVRRSRDEIALEVRFREATKSRQGLFGLASGQDAGSVQLTGSAPPAVVRAAAAAMLKQPVHLRDAAPLANDAPKTLSRYRMRTYALMPPLADTVARQRAALEQDLLVSAEHPPLSLSAASALESARRVRLDQLGGTVSGLYLEAVITRFINLPASASPLAHLDVLPGEPVKQRGGLYEVMMRFDIAPRWLGHRYFFVDLSSSPTP